MMDCKELKEKLTDYIEHDLNNDEELIINEHLNTCIECKNEYEELKSTMYYIIDNSNKIDTTKDIKLNTSIVRSKPIRRITRTGLIAIALSFIMIVTAFATDMFGIYEYWKKISERKISAWDQLIDNGVGQKLDISVIDEDIKITAEGVIADELNTVILLKIEDLKGNNRFVPNWAGGDVDPFKIEGDLADIHFSQIEILPKILNYAPLYDEEENTIRLIIGTAPINMDEGVIETTITQLENFYRPEGVEKKVVKGNWSLKIPVQLIKSETYTVDKSIDLEGNKLNIDRIIVAPTATNVEYTIETYNKEKNYNIKDITFLIKSGNKIYRKSELSRLIGAAFYEISTQESAYPIESLYLENLKEIELIVNTYSATTRGFSRYDIDYDNLPQELEFRGNKITLEEIKMDSDETIFIIRDDDSKDREYTMSNVSLRYDIVKKTIRDGRPYNERSGFTTIAHPVEMEIRDSRTGKKADPKDIKLAYDDDAFYRYVIRQELSISKDDLIYMKVDEDKWDEFLKPRQLIIQSLDFKKFPNTKLKISLK